MKKSIAFLAGTILLSACQSTQKAVCINGTLDGTDNDTLLVACYPLVPPMKAVAQTDTLVMADGTFTYTPPADSIPQEITFSPKGSGRYVSLMYLPGQPLSISGNLTDYRVEGNEINQLYAQRGTSFSNRQKCLDYIKAHPDNDFSLYLLSNLLVHVSQQNYMRKAMKEPLLDTSQLYQLFCQLEDSVKSGPLSSLYHYWDKQFRRGAAWQENQKHIAEGLPAPDFTLTDLQGKPLSLSSLRGKYVVLDFWGSWCGPCLDDMPKMKEYYARYQDRLEIVGIACNDTDERWRRAVADNRLPWLHVLNEKDDNDIGLLYAVEAYPTKIVIDPEGKIMHITLGEKPEFYEYLDKLFK